MPREFVRTLSRHHSARAHARHNKPTRPRRQGLLIAGVIRPDNRPSVALLNYHAGRYARVVDTLVADGLDRATADFDIDVREISSPMTDIDDAIDTATDAGTDSIAALFDVAGESSPPIGARHPQSIWGYIDVVVPGSLSLLFAEHEGSFLVGAAAALTSRTGKIGFVGGFQIEPVERFRAGFEAGARAVNPSIDILATYLDYYPMAFLRDDLAPPPRPAIMHSARVIFHAAGTPDTASSRQPAPKAPPSVTVGDRGRLRSVPRCRSAGATTRADVDDQEVRCRGVRARAKARR